MSLFIRVLFQCLAFVLSFALALNAVALVGTTDGVFDVSKNGTATYTIPIKVPPGVNGLEPNLAFVYNSQQGNGFLGVGWALSGLSSISRCAGNVALDGARSGIEFDVERFCLNGARLIPIEVREYRTEIESFSRIVSYGGTEQEPEYFVVWTKDGRKMEFGNSTDSRYDLSGVGTLTWAVNQEEDRLGNYMKVVYDNSSSGFYPANVQYRAVDSVVDVVKEVVFSYELRSDSIVRFMSGASLNIDKRLDTVSVKYNSEVVRTYYTEYELENTGSDRSRLKSIAECFDEGCYDVPLEFFWRDTGNDAYLEGVVVPIGGGEHFGENNKLVDINGDRVLDVVSANGTSVDVKLGYGDGTYQAPITTSNVLTAPTTAGFGMDQWNEFADVNGDGLVDIFQVSDPLNGAFSVHFGQENGTFWLEAEAGDGITYNANGFRFSNQLIDMNGDGLLDVFSTSSSGSNFMIRYGDFGEIDCGEFKCLSSGVVFHFDGQVTPAGASLSGFDGELGFRSNNLLADSDGDGIVDIIQLGNDGSVQVLLAAVDGTYELKNKLFGVLSYEQYNGIKFSGYINFFNQFVDVNSDGVLDVLRAVPTFETERIARIEAATHYGTIYDYNTCVLTRDEVHGGQFVKQYNDCQKHDYYADEIAVGSDIEIILGKGDGEFDVGNPINAEGAAEVFGLSFSPAAPGDPSGFLGFLDESTCTTTTFNDAGGSIFEQPLDGNGIPLGQITYFFDLVEHQGCAPTSYLPNNTKGLTHFNQFADMDGDGYIDIVSQSSTTGRLEVAYGDVDGTFTLPSVVDLTGTVDVDNGFRGWNRLADLNGDGLMDLFVVDPNTNLARSYISQRRKPSLLESVTNGYGLKIQIGYKTLADSSVYKWIGSVDGYPVQRVPLSLNVVAEHSVADKDLQSSYNYDFHYTYLYKDGRLDLTRGGLGFKEVTRLDENSRQETHTVYSQSYPTSGRPVYIMSRLEDPYNPSDRTAEAIDLNNKLNETEIDWGVRTVVYSTSQVHFVFKDSVVERVYEPDDLNGSSFNDSYDLITETITDYLGENSGGFLFKTWPYDEFGNPIIVQILNSVDSHVITTRYSNNYDINSDFLGHLLDQTVTRTHTTTDQTTKSFVTVNEFYSNGLLSRLVAQPDDTLSSEINYTYYADGRLQTHSAAGWDGNYDDNGNPAGGSSDTRTAIYTYSSLGAREWQQQETIEVNGVAHVETTVFDGYYGLKTEHTGPSGIKVNWSYDGAGRLLAQKDYYQTPSETITTTNYSSACGPNIDCANDARLVVTTTPPGASPTVSQHDAFGREIRVVTKAEDGIASIHKDTVYKENGLKDKVSNPYFSGDVPQWTIFGHDDFQRLVTTAFPNGAVAENIYIGLTTQTVRTTSDEGAQVTAYVRDSQEQIVTITDALGGVTNYIYGPFGELSGITDAAGNSFAFGYDAFGNKISQSDPDMGDWEYRYNAFGELKWQRDAKGQITGFEYDELGRITSRTEFSGATAVTTDWSYDNTGKGIGLLDFIERDGVAVRYNYDDVKRLQSEVTTITKTSGTEEYVVSTTYDDVNGTGRVDTVSYPNGGPTIKYGYHPNGFLNSISDTGTSVEYWRADDYSVFGQVASETWGNGISGERQYNDSTGRLTSISTGANSAIQNFVYGYYQSGNLKLRTNGNPNITEHFRFDALDRLTSVVSTAGESEAYTYDAIGNVTYKSSVGGYKYGETGSGAGPHAVSSISFEVSHAPSYTAADIDKTVEHIFGVGAAGVDCKLDNVIDVLDALCINKFVVDAASGGVNFSYSYDENGNMLTGAGRSVTYTQFNKPQSITYNNQTTIFSYGPDHQRLIKESGSAHTTYIGKLYEKIESGTDVEHRHFITAAGRLLAQVNEDSSGAQQVYYAHTDLLGSVDVLTDKDGNIVQSNSFDEYGQGRDGSWSNESATYSTTAWGYTGHEMDTETGLINMNARLYDPMLGRFMTADPFIPNIYNPQSLNRYSYVLNNPFRYVDPTGYVFEEIDTTGVFFDESTSSFMLDDGTIIDAAGNWVTPEGELNFGLPPSTAYANDVGEFAASPINFLESVSSIIATGAGGCAGKEGMCHSTEQFSSSVPAAQQISQSDSGAISTAEQKDNFEVLCDKDPVGCASLDSVPFLGPVVGVIGRGFFRAFGDEVVPNSTKALPSLQVPNAGGKIVSDVTKQDEVFFRVFSGDSTRGGFLTKVPPTSQRGAVEGLALPPGNNADFIQQVLVPAGTRLQRSRALPAFGRRGGKEQFQLLDNIPNENFGPGVPFK